MDNNFHQQDYLNNNYPPSSDTDPSLYNDPNNNNNNINTNDNNSNFDTNSNNSQQSALSELQLRDALAIIKSSLNASNPEEIIHLSRGQSMHNFRKIEIINNASERK